jgi:methyl-accepting chemotaxis protein
MATERWTDEMLDRLVGSISTLAEVSERNTRDTSDLKSSVEGLVNIAQMHQQSIEVVVTEIREMQAEVRGLQTENRRILDQFINRNGDNV